MSELGRNPGRIIPAWHDFAAEHAGAERLYGIGEPIWAGRSHDELVECHRHEALLNLAFAGLRGLPAAVSVRHGGARARGRRRGVPHASVHGRRRRRPATAPPTAGSRAIAAPFDAPLPSPPATAEEVAFDARTVPAVRIFVTCQAAAAGVGPARREDLVLAVDELVTNSVRHGGGRGTLRLWQRGRRDRLRGARRGPHRRSARRPRPPPSADARRRLRPLARQPALRSRRDSHPADGTIVRVRVARATAPV